VAVELKARTLVFLTSAPGLLADPADPASLLAEARARDGTRSGRRDWP